ncbi:helix-turn-helix transcriptional regulator [uncultured Anaerococcus sp.]|uniref:helix-turn-helix transcriptional regulator n=1 Tax=uncultured Anaerococcus sp. TaxID=293428 RepID=UPI00262F5274|nr:helix-turn-helix transcriptional regulator [uncultured Anaerococcus sp.]
MIIITNNIKIYRVIKGVNQSEMAKDIGITQQTLSSIENGASTNLKTAKKIAEYFGVGLDDIFLKKNTINTCKKDLIDNHLQQ